MAKYKIRLSKESGSKLYVSTVEAANEKEAFLLVVKEAESKGISVPKEVWTSSKEIK